MIKARPILAVSMLAAIAAVPLVISPLDAQQSDRTKQIGSRLKCMCGGCADAAAKCYHVGGAFSGPCDTAKAMLKEVDHHIAQGDSDDLTLQAFVQEYGSAVNVEPPHQGFGQVAWWTPTLTLTAGLVLVIFLILRWRKRPAPQAAGIGNAASITPELLERARARAARDTED